MAKPLNERTTTVLTNDRARTRDVENLITETETEQERAIQCRDAAARESVDFALSDEDREEAAAKAEKYGRTADMLANALDKLNERLIERRDSENSQAAEAERKAALAERDKLADEFAAFVPDALSRFVEVLQAVGANEERMRRAGLNEPNAEAKARGVTGFLGYAGEVESYRKMKIPAFDKPGRMWPVDTRAALGAAIMADLSKSREAQRKAYRDAQEEQAKAAKEHAEKHGIYRLSTSLHEVPVRIPKDLVTGRMPATVAMWSAWEGEVAHDIAAKLAEVEHLTITKLDKPLPTRLQNALRVAGLEGEELAAVQERLFEIGGRYGVSVNSLADLFGKATQIGREFGASQQDLLGLTEAVSQSLIVTGTSTQQASGAILGLTQALASGTVRAEEFNQINEGGLRPLLEAAAATERFGGNVNRLRAAILDGTVSSREFYDAIQANADIVAGKAANATLTLEGAIQSLSDAFNRYVGEAAEANGATTALAAGIQGLAQNLDTIIPALAVIATALGGRLVAGAVGGGAALQTLSAYSAVATTSLAGTALAARSAGAAILTAFGGPVGLAITGIAVALGTVAANASTAESRLASIQQRTEEGEREARAYARRLEEAGVATADLGRFAASASDDVAGLSGQLSEAARRAVELTQRLREAGIYSGLQSNLDRQNELTQRINEAESRGGQSNNPFLAQTAIGDARGLTDTRIREDQAELSALRNEQETLEARAAMIRLAYANGVDLSGSVPSPAATSPSASASTSASPSDRAGRSGTTADQIESRAQQEISRLRQEELVAQIRTTTDAQERADLEHQLLRSEHEQRRAQIEASEDFTDAQKQAQLKHLKRLYGPLGGASDGSITVAGGNSLYGDQIERELSEELTSQRLEQLRMEARALEATASVTDSLDSRSELEREALRLQQQIEDELLRQRIANGQVADADEAQAILARQQAAERERLRLVQRSPGQAYVEALEGTAANIGDEIERIKIDGLEALNDGLVDAITGAESLGDVFSSVADQIIKDLIRIAIQQAVIQPLANSLFGGTGDAGGGLLGGLFGSIFGGARASGGPVTGGKAYLVGEEGPEMFVPGASGSIVPNQQLAGAAGAGPVTINVHVVKGELFDAQVEGIADNRAVLVQRAALPSTISLAANEVFRRANRPTI